MYNHRATYYADLEKRITEPAKVLNRLVYPPDVKTFMLSPRLYFNDELINTSNISFVCETLTAKEFYLDNETEETKLFYCIYPVNNYKDHEYFHLSKELIPYEYYVKGKYKKNCCDCLTYQRKKTKNDYEGRPACASCWGNKERQTKRVLDKIG
jgi:hypothetical protein